MDLLGFEVAMDMGWVVTVASPTNLSAQVTTVGNDDMAAPGISVEVADVDAVHALAVEQGREIVYPLRDDEWSGASCSASRVARLSTSCRTGPAEGRAALAFVAEPQSEHPLLLFLRSEPLVSAS